MIREVGFIGLGTMGYSMAGWLSKKYKLSVFNRSAGKSIKWLEDYDGRVVADAKDIFINCDVVILCVGQDQDLRSLLLEGDSLLSLMKPGSYLIDHTTASKNIAEEIAKIADTYNVSFFDAPVSGGEVGAQNGQLTIMLGGNENAYPEIQPLLDCYSKRHELIGPNGHGQLAKMVNQIALAGLIQALAEAINFGQSTGIDMDKVLGTISEGAAQSWQMNNRSKTMLRNKFDFGFATQWMAKDLEICLDESLSNGAKLPVTREVLAFYKILIESGYSRSDTSSLIKLLRLNSNPSTKISGNVFF